MEEYVKDCILMNEFQDLVLLHLVELTIAADRTGRPLFPSPINEPVFYRKHFQVWVQEALEERERLKAIEEGNELE